MSEYVKENDNSKNGCGNGRKRRVICAVLILVLIAGIVFACIKIFGGDKTNNKISQKDKLADENAVIPREFITNDGEIITYDDAVNRIEADAREYMKTMGTAQDKADFVVKDIKDLLYKQEYEAEARAVSNHGIRHIYEAYVRSKNYLASLDDITAEQKLAALVSQVYHDAGYLEKPNNTGMNKGGSDTEHDNSSLVIWQSDERKAVYSEVFSASAVSVINTAVGRHNSRNLSNIRLNTSLSANPVVSAVHISDMLALSQREIFPEILMCDSRLIELTSGMNCVLPVLKDENVGFFDGEGNLTSKGELFLTEYQDIICDYIDSLGFDEEYASGLKLAVNKDVDLGTGELFSRANYIYVPSDAFVYNSKSKRNELTVYLIKPESDEADDIGRVQLAALYKRLGLSEEKAQEASGEKEYEFADGRGMTVIVKTIDIKKIVSEEEKKFGKNTDIEDVNRLINHGISEYEDLSAKLSKVVAYMGDSTISYSDFKEITKISGDKSTLYTEDGFESLNPLEKRDAVNEIMSGMIFDKLAKTLE